METLASMPGGCGGEHLLIGPRAAAEEVFGPALPVGFHILDRGRTRQGIC